MARMSQRFLRRAARENVEDAYREPGIRTITHNDFELRAYAPVTANVVTQPCSGVESGVKLLNCYLQSLRTGDSAKGVKQKPPAHNAIRRPAFSNGYANVNARIEIIQVGTLDRHTGTMAERIVAQRRKAHFDQAHCIFRKRHS